MKPVIDKFVAFSFMSKTASRTKIIMIPGKIISNSYQKTNRNGRK
jgi:hypothetical protein